MQVDLEINLQRIAMLNFGQSIWQIPQVSRLIKQLFYSEDVLCEVTRYQFWNELTAKIFENLKKQPLPECLKRELIYIIEHMAGEIYDWHDFVFRLNTSVYKKHNQELDYPKQLFWTLHGTIDVKRVIEENWLNNVHSGNIFAVYNVSCRNGVEAQKVDKIWSSMKTERQDQYKNQFFNEAAYANAYYMNLRDRDIQLFARTLRFIMEERLLEPFVEQGHVELLKNLWPKLSQPTKDNQIVSLCRLALNRWQDCSMKFEKKQYAKVVVFLLGQMSSEQREEINSNVDQFLRLLSSYPWQGLLLKVFNEYCCAVIENKNRVISEFLLFIVDLIGVLGKTSLYRDVLRSIWYDMPNEIKRTIDLSQVVCCLIKARDFTNVKIILETPEMCDKKDQLMQSVKYFLRKQINQDILREFVEEMFSTDDQRIDFINEIFNYQLK